MLKLVPLSRNACLPLFLLTFLVGCGSTQIIDKPVPIEVPGPVEWREIPPDLLIQHVKSDIPETLTWSEVAQLWTADRENLDILNAQILGIKSLNDSE